MLDDESSTSSAIGLRPFGEAQSKATIGRGVGWWKFHIIGHWFEAFWRSSKQSHESFWGKNSKQTQSKATMKVPHHRPLVWGLLEKLKAKPREFLGKLKARSREFLGRGLLGKLKAKSPEFLRSVGWWNSHIAHWFEAFWETKNKASRAMLKMGTFWKSSEQSQQSLCSKGAMDSLGSNWALLENSKQTKESIAQNGSWAAYAQTGQYHTLVESRVHLTIHII